MRRRNLIWTTILAVCLTAAGTAFGGVTINSNSVDFAIDGEGGTLKVKGPGNHQFSQSFKGQDVSFSLFDSDGGVLADGLYKYEVAIVGAAVGDRDDHLGQGQYFTGTFSVANGVFVNPGIIEGGFNKDQQILDDLIVDGSICAGQDCVNGESFGFDTLRLKENNLRIRAFDTSNSASFPTRDWQITFNDSSNGGANKFSIDDIDGGRTPFTIEGGAPSHSLYVDDGGRIGLGTNQPVVQGLHIKDGNTPTVRLEQDGTSGFGAQTWDLAGNEANFFIRDATNGSTLPFRIFPGAPSNALTIEASGQIGMGTTSPDANLDIESTDAFTFLRLSALAASPNTQADITFTDGAADGSLRFNIQDGDTQELAIDANGSVRLQSNCIEFNSGLGTSVACTATASTFTCGASGSTCP